MIMLITFIQYSDIFDIFKGKLSSMENLTTENKV